MNQLKVVQFDDHTAQLGERDFDVRFPSKLGCLFSVTDLWDVSHVRKLYIQWLTHKVKHKDPEVVRLLNLIAAAVMDDTSYPVFLVQGREDIHAEALQEFILNAIQGASDG
ncbi:hypothetical protein Axy22_010 [Achromobacter phage vB_AxyP_19-32_Axy22]|uniref:Uncharacterized protein n=2 Tax=Pourcelvirus TaxID=2842976 RepID=A0A514CVZ4_9CAUD|nr:hypothetical protein KMC59_gp11 [Achromobacter phage vB_AxyP_19-32_Axy10]QDH83967.1 hypothetical protein Axy10_011 [Achromobacter phage vB_AxyP_19-32_Axy10]QDH84643.1 hypothetical protein Axy22_010 [Achromobacter phage vB_AxyP_19-32_Axy22]